MSNSMLFFNPVFPLWIVFIITGLIASFLLWKESKRKQKFPWLRLGAQLLVVFSLLAVLLRPGYTFERKSTGIAILTKGYKKEKIDSLITALPDLRLIHTPGTEQYHQSELLNSYFELKALGNEIEFIVGEGLPDYALKFIQTKNFQFIQTEAPKGIVQLRLPDIIKVNQHADVTGQIRTKEPTTITLTGPGGKDDSVLIKGNTLSKFVLKLKPKKAGLYVYTITYQTEFQKVSEPLPIVVTEDQTLNILLLQHSPSFEIRQLKNFLAEKGHRLALRYQVSKNNYRFEYANTSQTKINQLSTSLLQSLDLLILDEVVLKSLSSGEKNVLEESVRNGLGVILLLNNASEKEQVRERFLPMEMKRSVKDTVQLNLLNKIYTLPIVPLKITDESKIFPVFKKQNMILSAYAYLGMGKSGVQLIQETYRVALEGNISDYARLWSPLLEKVARTKNEKFKIIMKNNFPTYTDEPLYPFIISTVNDYPELLDDSTPIPLSEHVIINNIWHGETWADEPGWHVFSADSSTLHYFVSDPNDWKSLRTANQILANKAAETDSLIPPSEQKNTHRRVISPVIFFAIFLFASAFLWLAPKI